MGRRLAAWFGLAACLGGCVVNEGRDVDLEGQDVLLTLLHTADIHSRWFPYELQVGEVDRRLGLLQDNGPFGGGARLAYLVKRERGRSGRVLYLDSGDPFQGAPVFNFFEGEVEFRVLSEIGLDGMVIGNHEFDRGGTTLGRQLQDWARFPALAANYTFEPSAYSTNALARLIKPWVVFNVRGLRVAVIGVGDVSSMHSIFETGNRLGITPLERNHATQQWIDFLRPMADVIVALTHEGPHADQDLIENTTGLDVVLGGHLHIVIDPPKVLRDCQENWIRESHGCSPRSVILAHSGGFLKYLGRLDVVLHQPSADESPDYEPLDRFEVASHEYTLFPVDSTVPEDPAVAYMLEPYAIEMEQAIDLDRLIGYAPTKVRRFGSQGGDSQLGNLVAEGMWLRRGIETDFALTNTTGIRADLDEGPVTVEMMFNVFPFDNTITTMFLSGLEVIDLFDYVARRTASRGCSAQAQIAGAKVVLNCRGSTSCLSCRNECGGVRCMEPCLDDGTCATPCASTPCVEAIEMGSGAAARAVDELGSYELATNNYLAQGGSGYVMLRRNTTQQDSGIPQRDAAIDRIRSGRPCVWPERTCSSDADCEPDVQACACDGRWRWNETTMACQADGSCAGEGRCVPVACVDAVALLYARRTAGPADDPDELGCGFRGFAGSECAEVACVDRNVGAVEDGRIRAYLP